MRVIYDGAAGRVDQTASYRACIESQPLPIKPGYFLMMLSSKFLLDLESEKLAGNNI